MKQYALVSLGIPVLACHVFGQVKAPISARECVSIRYLNRDYYHPAIQIAPDGATLFYVVKVPNLATNRNDMKLYIKSVSTDKPENPGKLLLTSATISQVQWLRDSRHLLLITNDGGYSGVVVLDSSSGKRDVVARSTSEITEYSIDASENKLLFITATKVYSPVSEVNAKEQARGYLVSPIESAHTIEPIKKIYLTRRTLSGWALPQPLSIRSPVTGVVLSEFRQSFDMHLSVSPDGRRFAITYLADADVPEKWKVSPLVKARLDGGGSAMITVVHDLRTGADKIPLQSASYFSVPLWSSDNKRFVVVAESPVGSRWAQQDAVDHPGITSLHLFEVEVDTNDVRIVAPHIEGIQGPLIWRRDGAMLVHTAPSELSWLTRNHGGFWEVKSSIKLPLQHAYPHGELQSNGRYVVGDFQEVTTPPSIFLYDVVKSTIGTVTELDPQFKNFNIAPAESIHWTTSLGEEVRGVLIKPIDYQSNTRYPLVIQTKPVSGQFLCDTGESHYPSFAPQPLAASGIMYLAREDAEGAGLSKFPEGYPGGISEAAQQMDVWDSAVKKLDRDGLIDPSRVGIIGFSRSGWYTEFILTHSAIRYRAATLADNVSYMLSEYWLFHNKATIRGFDAMYGGPPYEDTLKNWIEYSPSFAIDKIHAPILLEVMGYGAPFQNKESPPALLTARDELVVGLTRLRKPIEMYYYPDEEHQPDHPIARLYSLQRNVDWYRFWLQGYERPFPDDPQQYVRWRHLKDEQDEDLARQVRSMNP